MTHIPAYLKHFREHGYAIVEDVLTPEELAKAQQEIHSIFPRLEEYQYQQAMGSTDHRGYTKNLPYLGDVLNAVAVSPKIVSMAERILNTKKITLVTSHVWAKYPGAENYDQPFHTDYSSATLLYPNKLSPLTKMTTFILYYEDVDEEVGPTCVVSEQHSRDELLVPDIRPRSEYPELYEHELPVQLRAGSMLVYNMTIFHRGSALTSKNKVRYSHHMTFQSADAPWLGYNVWARESLSPEMKRFIGLLSPRQRELFGFPPIGHSYWKEETLTGIAALYPLMDVTPYIEAADFSTKQKNQLRAKLERPLLPAKETKQLSEAETYSYYRGVADYCAAMSGVEARYWLPWLLAYAGGRVAPLAREAGVSIKPGAQAPGMKSTTAI